MYQYPYASALSHYLDLAVSPIKSILGYEPHPLFNILVSLINGSCARKSFVVYEKDLLYNINSYDVAHSVEMQGANGKSNARSLAKLGALLANGGELNGIRLLKQATLEKALTKLIAEYDCSLELQVQRSYGGFGFFSNEFNSKIRGNASFYGWFGLGGSLLAWNPEKQISISYVMNALGAPEDIIDKRGISLLSSFFEALEKGN